MRRSTDNFKDRVQSLVLQIPKGRVMTYGQLAALCGSPRAARIVGGIAHYGGAYLHTVLDCPCTKRREPLKLLAQRSVGNATMLASRTSDVRLAHSSLPPSAASKCEGCGGLKLPWHRVVNKTGGLASGYPGGKAGHQKDLEAEGVKAEDYKVNIEKLLWHPYLEDRR